MKYSYKEIWACLFPLFDSGGVEISVGSMVDLTSSLADSWRENTLYVYQTSWQGDLTPSDLYFIIHHVIIISSSSSSFRSILGWLLSEALAFFPRHYINIECTWTFQYHETFFRSCYNYVLHCERDNFLFSCK